jgi:transcription elongation factor GreB
VVDPLRQGDNDQVFFGARVTVADAEGNENTYTIVGVDEADVARGRISWISPLARALIKAREGDSIRFQSPVGIREMDIIEVFYDRIE